MRYFDCSPLSLQTVTCDDDECAELQTLILNAISRTLDWALLHSHFEDRRVPVVIVELLAILLNLLVDRLQFIVGRKRVDG